MRIFLLVLASHSLADVSFLPFAPNNTKAFHWPDKVREERQVLDSKDRVIGRLRVTVQAVAALRAVKAGAPAGTPASQPGYAPQPQPTGYDPYGTQQPQQPVMPAYAGAPTDPPTHVRYLTTGQLQAVLRARGVHIAPSAVRAQQGNLVES